MGLSAQAKDDARRTPEQRVQSFTAGRFPVAQFDSSLKQFVEFGYVPVGDTGHAAQRALRTRILEVRTLEVPRAEPVAVLQP